MSRRFSRVAGLWGAGAALLTVACLTSACPDPEDPSCEPRPEECNNVDDDCNGRVDDNGSGGPMRRDCSNACGPGTEECQAGEWLYCSAEQPSEETCNGFDDDCDTLVDEDCTCEEGASRACGTDLGECDFGVQHCEGGRWGECQMAYDPDEHPEICDTLDNDCDGVSDEGCSCEPESTRECGTSEGECSPGTQTCRTDGTWEEVCVGEVPPQPDTCDGLDNDCDGVADWVVWADFGWDADTFEANDTCGESSPLYNASGLAELEQGGEWVSPDVSDPTELMTYPTLFPGGDEDWYSTRAVESSAWCVPWTSQCSFVVTGQLELLDRGYVEGAVQNPEDYRLCISTSDCATALDSALCTHGSDWNEDANSYVLAVTWGGTCTYSDSRDVKVRVHSPTGEACGHYQLYVRFDLADIECP